MNRFFSLHPIIALGIFAFLDVFCVGMGMGVPIFCILLGFPVGWYAAKRAIRLAGNVKDTLWKALAYAVVTSGITFLLMSVLWGPFSTVLLDPATDYVELGTPMILYEPQISFIGWLVLMILISPFLQFLTTILGSYLTLLASFDREIS